jgi:hypothetical protein
MSKALPQSKKSPRSPKSSAPFQSKTSSGSETKPPRKSRAKPRKYQLVLVEWIDAVADEPGWKGVDESHVDVCKTWSAGFLLEHNAEAVVIAATINDLKDTSERIAIPHRFVKKLSYVG